MNADRSMAHVWLALVASLVVGFVVAVASAADDPVALNDEVSMQPGSDASSLSVVESEAASRSAQHPLIL
jgi:hypothetical protein